MTLPTNKTKIVCTIGPASESREVLEHMIRRGMNIARLNFSHGDFSSHKAAIDNIRAAAKAVGQRVAIMADLPGPKMRIGQFAEEPVELKPGDTFTLTTEAVLGDQSRVSVSLSRLPLVVEPGDRLFINDGLVELRVVATDENNVHCEVKVGGELLSRKGLNLPGINFGMSAFTEQDHTCLKFAAEQGIDAVSLSFVETGADIGALRKAAEAMDYNPFVIAKIERAGALDHMDEIFQAADGIMIARGDLGVEIPIAQIAIVQKRLMEQANKIGKPVITATQMLESMTNNRRPTRAEATDVANAVLDGTDCLMLSGESATGKFPIEAVAMLADIAAAAEPHRPSHGLQEMLKTYGHEGNVSLTDLISLSVETTLERVSPAALIVPTHSGHTARMIARFKPPVWITAVSPQEHTCQCLQFSCGVAPVCNPEHPEDWTAFARNLVKTHGLEGNLVVLTEGPSPEHPTANHRMELIDLTRPEDAEE